jgi:hypothetical protein
MRRVTGTYIFPKIFTKTYLWAKITQLFASVLFVFTTLLQEILEEEEKGNSNVCF